MTDTGDISILAHLAALTAFHNLVTHTQQVCNAPSSERWQVKYRQQTPCLVKAYFLGLPDVYTHGYEGEQDSTGFFYKDTSTS